MSFFLIMSTKNDEYWIKQCFRLAKKGRGNVSPNPLVGCVIVKNGKLLGSGYHRYYGGAHAEINAIANAKGNGNKISGSTLYVNLEPCFHFGKTPPCVDAVIKEKFSRVVIAIKDPNSAVNGKSIAKLKRHRIAVTTRILETEAQNLNKFFFTRINKQRPFVALKYAETADGFIAKRDGSSKWITNYQSRKYVHSLRAQFDAILVGADTVIKDDPALTVRYVSGKNPIRIILDGNLRSPVSRKIFSTTNASTVVYVSKKTAVLKAKKIRLLENKNVIVIPFPQKNEKFSIPTLLKDLYKLGISSIMVEGGARTFQSFLNSSCVDYVYAFTAKKVHFHSGKEGVGILLAKKTTTESKISKFGSDELREFFVN